MIHMQCSSSNNSLQVRSALEIGIRSVMVSSEWDTGTSTGTVENRNSLTGTYLRKVYSVRNCILMTLVKHALNE
jgi:hypothetical protein